MTLSLEELGDVLRDVLERSDGLTVGDEQDHTHYEVGFSVEDADGTDWIMTVVRNGRDYPNRDQLLVVPLDRNDYDDFAGMSIETEAGERLDRESLTRGFRIIVGESPVNGQPPSDPNPATETNETGLFR